MDSADLPPVRPDPTGLRVLFAGMLCLAVAYASAFHPSADRIGAWAMVVGLLLAFAGILALGAQRPGRAGARRLLLPAALALGCIGGGFALALALPAESAGAPLVLGLPPRAAAILYGVGVLPLLVLPIAYAWTFRSLTLDADDLRRVREAALAARAPAAGDRTATSEAAGAREARP